MTKTILITGASSGIGAACVARSVNHGLKVIATARSKSKLEDLKNRFNDVQIVVADIACETGRNLIEQSLQQPIDYLLHNAAVLDSPQEFTDLSISDFRNNIVTNVEPIVFLTQKLLPHLKAAHDTPRILSISSGAAKQAIAGLGNYCISKAAALMASEILKVELPKHGVMANNYFPGAVDTKMQKTLRSSTTDIFPFSDDFKNMKAHKQLNDPHKVAEHIIEIFINSNNQEFAQTEWIFNEHSVLDKK
jgi:NAD(P)-dependent dehydrogenase (short-subunit alcohol dehydrogenase family)